MLTAALCLLCLMAAGSSPAYAVSGEEIVIEAEKYLGYPYGWSASGPDAFDCGGFTWYVYDQAGIDFGLRVSSAHLAEQGEIIDDPADLQLGDILFFGYGRSAISHWGIYSGYGYIIHSYNSSTGVVETPLEEVLPPFCYGVRLNQMPAYEERAPLVGTPSAWATAEIHMAIEAGLIPEAEQGGYQQVMTRGAFCSLLLQVCEVLSGQTAAEILADRGLTIDPTVFTDTKNEDILTAYALGLVSGKNDGTFGPEEPLSGEAAATLLGRLLALTGNQGACDPEYTLADLAETSAWSPTELVCYGAVGLPGGGPVPWAKTEPPIQDACLTREQAYISVMRLYNDLLIPTIPEQFPAVKSNLALFGAADFF